MGATGIAILVVPVLVVPILIVPVLEVPVLVVPVLIIPILVVPILVVLVVWTHGLPVEVGTPRRGRTAGPVGDAEVKRCLVILQDLGGGEAGVLQHHGDGGSN